MDFISETCKKMPFSAKKILLLPFGRGFLAEAMIAITKTKNMKYRKQTACVAGVALFLTALFQAVSCSSGGRMFAVEGRFLNLDQGEFYVYSPDGAITGLDTIHIKGGRFAWEKPCLREGTLILIAPNFSEQVIFAKPGESVTVKADASHLKEMEVSGTLDNELMSRFRKETSTLSPPETRKRAREIIERNAGERVALYLLNRYWAQDKTSDVREGLSLAERISAKAKDKADIQELKNRLSMRQKTALGAVLGDFEGQSTNGQKIRLKDLRGRVTVIYSVAGWSYQSTNFVYTLRKLHHRYGASLNLVGVSLDASQRDCEAFMRRDSVSWPVICDEDMFASRAVRSTGLLSVPDNIVLDKHGRIVAHSLTQEELEKRLALMIRQ